MAGEDDESVSFKQPYVYCGVCHSDEGSFYLTSCAHLLCSQHHDLCSSKPTDPSAQAPAGQPPAKSTGGASTKDGGAGSGPSNNNGSLLNTKSGDKAALVCPVCRTADISVVPLTRDALPRELQAYFRPYIASLESIYAIAKFQTDGLVVRCQRQIKTIAKLTAKYKEAVRRLREEMAKSSDLRLKLNEETAKWKKSVEQVVIMERELQDLRSRAAAAPSATSAAPSAVTYPGTARGSNPAPPVDTSTPLHSKPSSAAMAPPPGMLFARKPSNGGGDGRTSKEFVSSVQRSAITNPAQRVEKSPTNQFYHQQYLQQPPPQQQLNYANTGNENLYRNPQPNMMHQQPLPPQMYMGKAGSPAGSQVYRSSTDVQASSSRHHQHRQPHQQQTFVHNVPQPMMNQQYNNTNRPSGNRHGIPSTVIQEPMNMNVYGMQQQQHPGPVMYENMSSTHYGVAPQMHTNSTASRRGVAGTDIPHNTYYGRSQQQQYSSNNYGNPTAVRGIPMTGRLGIEVNSSIGSLGDIPQLRRSETTVTAPTYPTFQNNARAAAAVAVQASRGAQAEIASPFKRMYSRGSTGNNNQGDISRLSIPSTPTVSSRQRKK